MLFGIPPRTALTLDDGGLLALTFDNDVRGTVLVGDIGCLRGVVGLVSIGQHLQRCSSTEMQDGLVANLDAAKEPLAGRHHHHTATGTGGCVEGSLDGRRIVG